MMVAIYFIHLYLNQMAGQENTAKKGTAEMTPTMDYSAPSFARVIQTTQNCKYGCHMEQKIIKYVYFCFEDSSNNHHLDDI